MPASEVIVVVDGDVDGTVPAIRDAFPDVRVLVGDGSGAAAARNRGVASSRGDWVTFLDDDDLWHRDKLARTADYIADHPSCAALRTWTWLFAESASGPRSMFGLRRDFVASGLDECHAQGETTASANGFEYLAIEGHSLERLLERNAGIIGTSAVRSDVLGDVRPVPNELRFGEDWYFHVSVAAVTEWHTIPERLAFYRMHSTQATVTTYTAAEILRLIHRLWTDFGAPAGLELADFGPAYSSLTREMAWITLRQRDVRALLAMASEAAAVLPRARDRWSAIVPAPVVHRWARTRGRLRRRDHHGRSTRVGRD